MQADSVSMGLAQAGCEHGAGASTTSPLPHPAAAYSVKSILQSIQSLLADPNCASPLNLHAAKLWEAGQMEEYQVRA